MAGLAEELAGIVEAAEGANLDDEHDAEGPTVAFERQRVAALLDQARRSLAALERAAERAAAGTGGRCAACGGPIGSERLAAVPATTRCVACARRQDGRAPDGLRRR